MSTNLHTEYHRMLGREAKEALLRQHGHVFWLTGLSGSGKSTLAQATERQLHAAGVFTTLLDGDNIRTGLNKDLGFSNEDRLENIRRIAEVAKLFAQQGSVVFAAFITPTNELRELARDTVGARDFSLVSVEADFETCAQRDPKGLYAKAAQGGIQQFTGKDSVFETPAQPELVLNTEEHSADVLAQQLFDYAWPRIIASETPS